MALVGQEAKAVLTNKDQTTEVLGVISSADIEISGNNSILVTIEMVGGVGDAQVLSTPAFVKKYTEKVSHAEWECEYCSTMNPAEYRYCGGNGSSGCKAARSFLLSEM